MQRPPKKKKPKMGKGAEPPVPVSLKEKLKISAWIVGVFLVFAFLFHFAATRHQRASLDELLQRWVIAYHLNEEQARRIRAIEERFHGSGDPFTRPSHSRADTREHHRAMAAEMNPEDGKRFFRTQEGIELPTSPK